MLQLCGAESEGRAVAWLAEPGGVTDAVEHGWSENEPAGPSVAVGDEAGEGG